MTKEKISREELETIIRSLIGFEMFSLTSRAYCCICPDWEYLGAVVEHVSDAAANHIREKHNIFVNRED